MATGHSGDGGQLDNNPQRSSTRESDNGNVADRGIGMAEKNPKSSSDQDDKPDESGGKPPR